MQSILQLVSKKSKTLAVSLFTLLTLPQVAIGTGSEFFPIGIYGVGNSEAMQTVAQAGFNLVVTSPDADLLAMAYAHNLKAFITPNTHAGPDFATETAAKAIEAFDQHPAVWAWYIIDEPDLAGIPPKDVRFAADAMKVLGAKKPTGVVLFYGSSAYHYANIADITLIDRYPIPWMPISNFGQHTRDVALAVGPNKPWCAIIQAFDWTAHKQLLPGEDNLRPPTAEEIRNMTYVAIAQGASGILYYTFKDSNWSLRENPTTWKGVRDIAKELRNRMPLLTGERSWWASNTSVIENELRWNPSQEYAIETALIEVKEGNKSIPNGNYVVAVNTTRNFLNFKFKSPSSIISSVPVLDEDRSLELDANYLHDLLEPLGVHVYGPFPIKRPE